ncbi:MAG: winged helix-turn-helix transcriptional regulator [Dehalococcoidia bacterium]|nr:winged helix-turn-helix transcriptional regulator [Dehalococcoidia bacterium]
MKDLVKAFKALSDETRIRILKVLLERECCVCEIMQALDISQSRTSRNLSVLENAGFVRSRRNGLWKVYSINQQEMGNHANRLTEWLRGAAIDEQVVRQDRERLSHAVRVGPKAVPGRRNPKH